MNRKLGRDGPQLFPIGLGCMGMSEGYGERAERDERESIETIHRALDLGVNLLDTADIYGPHENELLVGRALQGRRSQAVLATKFGFVTDREKAKTRRIEDGRSTRAQRAMRVCAASASRRSTCGICIARIRWCRSKRLSVRWRSAFAPARCATSGSPR